MKKRLLSIVLSLTLVFGMIPMNSVLAQSLTEDQPAQPYIEISKTSTATTVYQQGDKFDPANLIINYYGVDESGKQEAAKEVKYNDTTAGNFSIDTTTALTTDDTYVTIAYRDVAGSSEWLQCNLPIAVYSLSVEKAPTKTTYYDTDNQESLDLTGGRLLVTGSDGTNETVNLDALGSNVESFLNKKEAKINFKYSYVYQKADDKSKTEAKSIALTASQDITVIPAYTATLSTKSAMKTTYNENDAFNPTGLIISVNDASKQTSTEIKYDATETTGNAKQFTFAAVDNDGKETAITTDSAMSVNYNAVKIVYTAGENDPSGMPKDYKVEVAVPVSVNSNYNVVITTNPTKMSYWEDDSSAKLDGLVLAVVDKTAEGKTVTSTVKYDDNTGDFSNIELDTKDSLVKFTYTGTAEDTNPYARNFEIPVTINPDNAITVVTAPETNYTEGQQFDPTGLEVKASIKGIEQKGTISYNDANQQGWFSFEPSLDTALTTENTVETITVTVPAGTISGQDKPIVFTTDLPIKVTATPAPIVPAGNYIIATDLVNNYKAVDISNASKENGANAQLYTTNATNAQNFTLSYNEDGTAKFTNVNSGKVLGVADDGVNVAQFTDVNSDSQKWNIVPSEDGTSYFIESVSTEKYLDVAAASTNNGTNLQVYEANSSQAQQFKFIQPTVVTAGTYNVKTSADTTKTLDIAGASKDNSANVQLYTNNGSQAQEFAIAANGNGYSLTADCSGKAVDVAGAGIANGTNVQQYDSNGTAAQQWAFIPAGEGSVYVVSLCSGLYLDVNAGQLEDNSNVQTYEANGSAAQIFTLNAVTEA